MIVHVCNDIGAWGKGFVMAISNRWPEPESRYRKWHREKETNDFGQTAAYILAAQHLRQLGCCFDAVLQRQYNRILTDHLSELLFTSEPAGDENLLKEGIPPERTHQVGNCMIDSLRLHLESAVARKPWDEYGLYPGRYGIVTLHRPTAVDDPSSLSEFRGALREIAEELPLVFPVHPNPEVRDSAAREFGSAPRVFLVEPLEYLDFVAAVFVRSPPLSRAQTDGVGRRRQVAGRAAP